MRQLILLLSPLGLLFSPNALADEFIRGDANGDGLVDISDAITMLDVLFQGAEIACEDAGDANDDGVLDISDPTYLLIHLFWGGAAPPEPFAQAGLDPTTEDPYLCGDRTCGRPGSGQVIHVNSGSAAGLQMAIDIAEPGDEVWVSADTYTTGSVSHGSSYQSNTQFLNDGVDLYGGFQESAECREDRNLDTPTILSGTDDPEFGPWTRHVVSAHSVHATLDGFAIQNGRATWMPSSSHHPYSYGGGLILFDSDLVIRNSDFRDNRAQVGGGAIYMVDSAADLENVLFSQNQAVDRGAAVCLRNSDIRIQDSTLAENRTWRGGSVRNQAIGGCGGANFSMTVNTTFRP